MPTPQVDATGKTDVSDQMAAFIAGLPDGSTIDLKCLGRYRMEKTLLLSKRKNLKINGNEASFILTTTGTTNRSNVRIQDCAGITIDRLHTIGANPHAGTSGDAYVAALEAQHGFDVFSTQDLHLSDCGAQDVYGDFICLSGAVGNPSRNVLIERFWGVRNGRQGIAVVNGDNITIDSPVLGDCRRAMFDFECNKDSHQATNITVRDGVFGAHVLNWVAAHGASKAMVGHIFFSDCTMKGGVMSVDVTSAAIEGTLARRFDFNFVRCTSDTPYGNPSHAAMIFKNTIGINVSDCVQPTKLTSKMYMVTTSRCQQVEVARNSGANMVGQVLVAVP